MFKVTAQFVLPFLMLPAFASAAENIDSKLLGMSADGSVVSFQQTTIYDGSGNASSKIIFVDTAKNKYAADSVSVTEGEADGTGTAKSVKEKALKKAAATLKKLNVLPTAKIDAAKLRLIYSKSNYIAGDDVTSLEFANRGAFWQRSAFGKAQYQLSLETSPAVDPTGFHDDLKLLTVKLTANSDRYNGTSTTRILQKDTRLPSSRSGARAYSISEVYLLDPASKDEDDAIDVKNGRILIVLDVYEQGFEGQTTDKMVVTGLLN